MRAVLCPVCNGSGEAGDWLKGLPLLTKSKCWGCDGKGWVEVGEDKPFIPSVVRYSYPPDKCPACGGDRNSPASTGCPKASHYGNYCEV